MYMSIIFKNILLRNHSANQSQILCEASLESGNKIYISCPGHMTKMAAMPIYDKTFKNLILQNNKSYDLRVWHVASGTLTYKVYVNDDPGLTLNYFTTGSILVTYIV